MAYENHHHVRPAQPSQPIIKGVPGSSIFSRLVVCATPLASVCHFPLTCGTPGVQLLHQSASQIYRPDGSQEPGLLGIPVAEEWPSLP